MLFSHTFEDGSDLVSVRPYCGRIVHIVVYNWNDARRSYKIQRTIDRRRAVEIIETARRQGADIYVRR